MSLTSDLERHMVTAASLVDSGAEPHSGRRPLADPLAIARFRAEYCRWSRSWVSISSCFARSLRRSWSRRTCSTPTGSTRTSCRRRGQPGGRFGGISWDHPLGVEPGTGRDLLSRLMLGHDLVAGHRAHRDAVTVIIGVVLGIVSGFSGRFRRRHGRTVHRPHAVVPGDDDAAGALGAGGPAAPHRRRRLARAGALHGPRRASGLYVILILAVFGWPPVARVVRGQVLSIREREYIEAARLMGASRLRLYFKEMLPNVWAPILVFFTLLVPAYISAEAAFSSSGSASSRRRPRSATSSPTR